PRVGLATSSTLRCWSRANHRVVRRKPALARRGALRSIPRLLPEALRAARQDLRALRTTAAPATLDIAGVEHVMRRLVATEAKYYERHGSNGTRDSGLSGKCSCRRELNKPDSQTVQQTHRLGPPSLVDRHPRLLLPTEIPLFAAWINRTCN